MISIYQRLILIPVPIPSSALLPPLSFGSLIQGAPPAQPGFVVRGLAGAFRLFKWSFIKFFFVFVHPSNQKEFSKLNK